MKRFLSVIIAALVFVTSFALPENANAATTGSGSCHLKVTSEKVELVESPSAVSGGAIAASGSAVEYKYSVSIKLKNTGKNRIKKASVKGTVGDETLKFSTGSLKSGKTVTLDKEFKSEKAGLEETTFKKNTVKVWYSSETDVYKYDTSDHTVPVISGFIGSGSYEKIDGETIPYRTVYSGQQNSFRFKKYVKATDNSGKTSLSVDTDKVNFNKKGIYTIYYIAKDKSGNSRKVLAKIAVRKGSDTLDRYSQQVLNSITRSSWSDTAKAKAICRYVNGHVKYTGNHRSRNWETEAVNGLRYGSGDCITYYSTVRALLTRAGIPNIKVKLVNNPRRRHAWNMAYVSGGFYHIDACPRKHAKIFCLVTDAQLKRYASGADRGSHVWDYSHIPHTPSKTIGYIR